jgi:Zn-dependent M32 family carboxypeptidase
MQNIKSSYQFDKFLFSPNVVKAWTYFFPLQVNFVIWVSFMYYHKHMGSVKLFFTIHEFGWLVYKFNSVDDKLTVSPVARTWCMAGH